MRHRLVMLGVVQPMDGFVRSFEAGRIQSYTDVVFQGYIPP